MDEGFWGPPISVYTRAQAIDDGMLIPTTELCNEDLAKQAGFKWPMALSSSVAAIVEPAEREVAFGQDIKGRLWDLVWMLKQTIRRSPNGTELLFRVSFTMIRDGSGRRQIEYVFKCVTGPGDEAEPVMTIMLPEED